MSQGGLATTHEIIGLGRTIRNSLEPGDVLLTVAIPCKNILQITITTESSRYKLNLDRVNLDLIKNGLEVDEHARVLKKLEDIHGGNASRCALGNLHNTGRLELNDKPSSIALLKGARELTVELSPSPSKAEGHGVRAAIRAAAVVTRHLKWKRTTLGGPWSRSPVILGRPGLGPQVG